MGRDFDLVVWVATGFTGRLATAYLLGDQTPFHSVALHGLAAAPIFAGARRDATAPSSRRSGRRPWSYATPKTRRPWTASPRARA